MKRIFLLCLSLITLAAVAQPPKRIAERKAAQESRTHNVATSGARYREFPVAPPMPEDVVWKRDVYRKLPLSNEHNAVLGYPMTPQPGSCNLFTYLMKSILRRQIKAYRYDINTGVEDFRADQEISAKKIMDDKNIFYEVKDGRMHVEDADLSVPDVRMYYIKESIYFDQHTSTFRTQVTALCPVIVRGDSEFGGADMEYPVCWISYADAEPYLSKLMLMESSLNNAATISAADYFTMNKYVGDIYRVVNLQDKMLLPTSASDSVTIKAQARVETELADFRKDIWKKDVAATALDTVKTVAVEQPKADKKKEKKSSSRLSRRRSSKSSRRSSSKPAKVKKQRKTSSKRSSGLSVRRQRH